MIAHTRVAEAVGQVWETSGTGYRLTEMNSERRIKIIVDCGLQSGD